MRRFLTLFLILSIFISFKISLAKEEFLVTNTNSLGPGSFLYAIEKAVDSGGVVKFDIPYEDKNFNGKCWIIKLKSPIPEITKSIIIDGLSQTLKYGDKNPDGPEILIDASMVVGSQSLFYFRKSGFEISGIKIKGFKGENFIEVKKAKGYIHDICLEDGDIGIHLYKGNGVKIKNSSFRNLEYGIYLYYSNYNTIDGVDVRDCDYGIRLYYSMTNEIENSSVSGCNSGIRVFYNSISNKIHDNKLINNRDGVWLRDSHNMKNDIFKNEFIENENGVHLLYATKTKVYSNSFKENERGIFIESFSEKNEINSNTFEKNEVGIYINNYSKENILRENSFSFNKKAIFIEDKTSILNTISRNVITNNSYRGIIVNSDEKIPPPKIIKAGVVGRGVVVKIESEKEGTVELFLSNYDGKSSPHPLDEDSPPYHGDSKKFLGEGDVKPDKSIFMVISDAKEGDFITATFTNRDGGTSEFSLNKKLNSFPFLDATLSISGGGGRGERVKFLLKIKNKGKAPVSGVKFQCEIPSPLKDVKIDSIPQNSKGYIDNNTLYVEDLSINGNSFVSLSFSSLIPDSLKVGEKLSLQGEVEYSPIEGFLIKEKTDRDEFDDEIPGSDVGDEETYLTILGKPDLTLNVDLPERVDGNSTFNVNVKIKNRGNDTAKNIQFFFKIPEGFNFITSTSGGYSSDDRTFNFNLESLKPNEEKAIFITLKSSDPMDDKTFHLSFVLKGEGISTIESSFNITIKGKGRENVIFNILSPESVKLLDEFEIELTFKNEGNRESEEKNVKLIFDDGVKFISSNISPNLKKNEILYTLKPLLPNESKIINLKFKITDGCKSYKNFTLYVGDKKEEFKVFVSCIRVYHHPIISGFPDNTFRPNLPLKRVEASAILTNALLLKPSLSILPSDVSRNYWGVKFISSVIGNGIMKGYPDGTFKPEKFMTRMEACVVVFKLLSLREDYSIEFKDVDENYWGKGIIGGVVKEGIMKGYPDGTFKPEKFITRSEFLVIILKTIGRGKPNFTIEGMFKDVKKDFWAYPFIVEATVPHIVINPEKVGEININGENFPVFGEKFNSIVKIVKIGDKIKVSVPFLYKDLREVEITVVKVGVKP